MSIKITKEIMRKKILSVASADQDFLMNDCHGVDLMMDAVSDSVKKMKRDELKTLYLKSLQSIWDEEESK